MRRTTDKTESVRYSTMLLLGVFIRRCCGIGVRYGRKPWLILMLRGLVLWLREVTSIPRPCPGSFHRDPSDARSSCHITAAQSLKYRLEHILCHIIIKTCAKYNGFQPTATGVTINVTVGNVTNSGTLSSGTDSSNHCPWCYASSMAHHSIAETTIGKS